MQRKKLMKKGISLGLAVLMSIGSVMPISAEEQLAQTSQEESTAAVEIQSESAADVGNAVVQQEDVAEDSAELSGDDVAEKMSEVDEATQNVTEVTELGAEKSDEVKQELDESGNATESNEAAQAAQDSSVAVYESETVRPEAVTDLKAQVVNWNQVKLTWTESDAEGYLIYRKTAEEDKFSYLYMVSKDSYVDTKALRGNYNFYRVYPYNKDEEGNLVVGASTTYVFAKPGEGPDGVTNLKASLQSSDYVKLTWNASKEAEGYLIYRKTEDDDKFVYRYMVEGTSFTDTTAAQCSYNYYRVYPYYKKADGTMCTGPSRSYVYAKPLGLPKVCDLSASLDEQSGGLEISWSLDYGYYYNDDWDGVIIYRKIGKDGSFKYLDLVKEENLWGYSYEDTTASISDYNYYMVYVYKEDANGKKHVGPCTSYASGKASVGAVYNLYSYEQIDQVRIQWEKNNTSKATGYYVYRKQDDGKFEYIGSTKKTEYIDKSASKSTMNYYRVYPYRTVSGKNIVGQSVEYVYGKAKNYSKGQAIADYGWQFIGTPYVWGGNDLKKGVDCSGFTTQVYKHFGISLPRTSARQAESGKDIGRDLSKAKPGDIITFCYSLDEDACHTSIYLGNGRIIHSTSAYRSDGTEINGIQIGNANYMTIKSIRRYY